MNQTKSYQSWPFTRLFHPLHRTACVLPANKFLPVLLMYLQVSQPPTGIFKFRKTRVRIFPEVEEFFVLFYGFSCVAPLFINFAEHIEGLDIKVSLPQSAGAKTGKKSFFRINEATKVSRLGFIFVPRGNPSSMFRKSARRFSAL
jgi:hypothetical protein